MIGENGKNLENLANNLSKIFEKPFREVSINVIRDKLKKNELSIEDILSNNECIEDLKTNSSSRYKKILTTKNILKLISYCLYPPETESNISYNTLRFPYYSCDLLCSPAVLQLSNSKESIKMANDAEKKSREKELMKEPEEEKEKKEQEKNLDENDINESGDIFHIKEKKEEDVKNIFLDYEEIFNFQEYKKREISHQMDTMEKEEKTEFNEEDNDTIKEIMDKIINFLDNKFHFDETYVGYFQKIFNFLLLNESKITIDYLFREDSTTVKKFYDHIDNASIENTFENILNYISDKENLETNLEYSRFNFIILELLDEIGGKINKQYDISNNNEYIIYIEDRNKIEFICELIMNTLIINTEKNLIELVLNSNSIFMEKIILLIEQSVNLEYKYDINNKKTLIINLLKITRQINSVIMNSKNVIINTFKDPYIKIKTFENQYFCKKYINKDKIYQAFENNRDMFIKSTKKIYELMKNDIIKNTNLDCEHGQEKGKTLMLINSWKYILSGLKIFIFQFYAMENFKFFEDDKDFFYEDLFELSLNYYFKYPKNNIYQNVFVDIIKLLNLERAPKYLIQYFIQKQNNFIENINKTLASGDKYNSLLGSSIQILLIFYTSSNPALIEFYNNEENSKEKKYRDEFIDIIKPKFERKFDENYEYYKEEMFADIHDDEDTFDGNDIKNYSKIKFDSFKTVVLNFLNRAKNNNLKEMSQASNTNQQQKQEEEKKETTEIKISSNITIVSESKEEVKEGNGNNTPSLSRTNKLSLK